MRIVSGCEGNPDKRRVLRLSPEIQITWVWVAMTTGHARKVFVSEC